MTECEKIIEGRLFELRDEKYRVFAASLMPTVPPQTVIGVRTPALRKYAAEISGTPLAEEFMSVLPHRYYEENNLHAFLIDKIKAPGRALSEVERFLPYVDNWATCDGMTVKALEKDTEALLLKIKEWINSDKTYTVRYGIGSLMRRFSDERFSPEYLDMVAGVKSEEYYINMMAAWYFATELAKHYDETLPYIEKHILSPWVHNKTIQKACESRRIVDERKKYLQTLKIKENA